MGRRGRDEAGRLALPESDEPLVTVVGLSEWVAEIALEAGFLVFPTADRGPGVRGEKADREHDGDR